MSLTDRRAKTSTSSSHLDDRHEPIVAVAPPSKRRRPLILLGGLMVVVSALVAAWLVASASETHRVLVAQGDLAPDQPVEIGDLSVVEVGGGLEASSITADEQSAILGKFPAGLIPDGTLLQAAMFIPEDEVVPDGKVVVAAMLEPGQLPAGVEPGTGVELISTVGSDQGTAAASIGVGTIFALSETDQQYWVSLLVDQGQQLEVAAAAASDELRIGLVP